MTLRISNRTPEEAEAATSRATFDPILSAALERTESAAGHVRAAQRDLWRLAKKDPAFNAIVLQLTALLGSLEARRYVLEEEAGGL